MAISFVFTEFIEALANKEIDMNTDTFKVALMASQPTAVQQRSWATYSDISSREVSYTSTPAGPETLTSPTLTVDASASIARVNWSGAQVDWTSATITCVGCIIYADLSSGNKYPVCYIDFGGSKTVTSGTFTIKWNGGATGDIMRMTSPNSDT